MTDLLAIKDTGLQFDWTHPSLECFVDATLAIHDCGKLHSRLVLNFFATLLWESNKLALVGKGSIDTEFTSL